MYKRNPMEEDVCHASDPYMYLAFTCFTSAFYPQLGQKIAGNFRTTV
jgi:hypothetical protein